MVIVMMDHNTAALGTALLETYSVPLIFLSILIAVLASFTAFGLAERQYSSVHKIHKIMWNIFGAIAMGLGIWAMHFIGMLALSLPVPVYYDIFITFISIIPAVSACGVILWVMAQNKIRIRDVWVGGTLLGLGIGSMHYMGMAAMIMDAEMIHHTELFYLSIILAVILSIVVVTVSLQNRGSTEYKFLSKGLLVKSLVMGGGTSAIHYIAMASVDFRTLPLTPSSNGMDADILLLIVSVVSMGILLIAIALPFALRYKQVLIELNNNFRNLDFALKSSNQAWVEFYPQTGNIITSNEYARLLDYAPENFNTNLTIWLDNIHPDDLSAVQNAMGKIELTDAPVEQEYRRKKRGGGWVWLHFIGQVIERNKAGKPTRIIGTQRDISHRKQCEKVLRILAESDPVGMDNIFQLIVKQLASSQNVRYVFIAQVNDHDPYKIESLVVWADNKLAPNIFYDLRDTPCAEVLSQRICFYPDNIQAQFPKDTLLTTMEAESYIGIPLVNAHKKVVGFIAMIDDKPMKLTSHLVSLLETLAVRVVTELERSEVNKTLALTSRVFGKIHDGILITDGDHIIVDSNPAFYELTGYSQSEILGQKSLFRGAEKENAEFYVEMWKEINEHGHWSGELWNCKKTGEFYAESLTVSTLKDETGKVINYVGVFADITDKKRHQKELEKMAYYDALTHLPNRTLFADRFVLAMAHAKRTDQLLAVCFLDLDHFKEVNDNYGHDHGDALLLEVTTRIKHSIREEDTLARFGGDEFALLLNDIDSREHCEDILNRVCNALSNTPCIVGEDEHEISVSIGVTLYPDDNSEMETLMRHADQAMYQSKINGRNRYTLFNGQGKQQTTFKKNKLIEITLGLENNEFCLHYQPKVNMRTGELLGAEALLRWNHPEKGLVLPAEFLPDIKETELEFILGEWVINEALQQLDKWIKQGIHLEVSINIASYHLQSSAFIPHLKTMLLKWPDVQPSYLQIEILEGNALDNLMSLNDTIKECRDSLGIKVALDDFGIAYSSLSHLRNLSADIIKIDRSFIRDMLDDPDDYSIIEGIIDLASSFRRQIVAEGIETESQGEMLMLMGCDLAQGYFISKPMPAEQIPVWLDRYPANQKWLESKEITLNERDKRLELLMLLITQWHQRFTKNLFLAEDKIEFWPISNREQCGCGRWITAEMDNSLFDKEWLSDLQSLHDKLHTSADDLKSHYLLGELEIARVGVNDLNIAYDSMHQSVQKRA
ncbi:MAG: diguanylate cyclase [Gammaproteobacteria bacterium]|nr:MAG: diguanylate cyclase [Gammaproteobacteria bacterium]